METVRPLACAAAVGMVLAGCAGPRLQPPPVDPAQVARLLERLDDGGFWERLSVVHEIVDADPAGAVAIPSLVERFTSADWLTVWIAKLGLESYQERALENILPLLLRTDRVPLQNTADLIYPGARAFYGHGFIVDYDIDLISVRAGWLVEELTFRPFGFSEGALRHDDLLAAALAGRTNVPLQSVVGDDAGATAKNAARREAGRRVFAWWKEAQGRWTRLEGLIDAMRSGDPDRQIRTISWIRNGDTRCDGLTSQYFECRISPLIQDLSVSENEVLRSQCRLLLEDDEGYWRKRKTGQWE